MGRPRVITCNVASVDGRITVAPGVSLLAGDDDRWATVAGTTDVYAWARAVHQPEVLLEGSGSFVGAEAPATAAGPTVGAGHADVHLPPEVVDVPGRRWMAVVDGRGRVPLSFTEWPDPDWAGWHALVLTSGAAPAAHCAWLRALGLPYVVAGPGPTVDLAVALRVLHEDLGVRTVVSTGGGGLNGALLRAGLVDEVDIEILPAVIGGRGTPALFDAPPLQPAESPVRLRLVSVDVGDDQHVRMRWAVDQDAGR